MPSEPSALELLLDWWWTVILPALIAFGRRLLVLSDQHKDLERDVRLLELTNRHQDSQRQELLHTLEANNTVVLAKIERLENKMSEINQALK